MQDYNQTLDNILNYFYDNKGENVIPSDIQNKFEIDKDLFFACVEKIHRSSYIDKLNNERAEHAICKINLDGILFKESGGFVQERNYKKIVMENIAIDIRNKKRNEILLIIGTCLAGIGAISLTIWEMYKSFCLHK